MVRQPFHEEKKLGDLPTIQPGFPYFVGIFPYIGLKIGLIYGRYLQFRILEWPLRYGFNPETMGKFTKKNHGLRPMGLQMAPKVSSICGQFLGVSADKNLSSFVFLGVDHVDPYPLVNIQKTMENHHF